MDETWSVGPPPPPAGNAGQSRRGAVLAVLALVAGFVGGLGAGYALDDPAPPREVDAVGAPLGASDDEAATSDVRDGASVPATTFGSSGSSAGPMARERLFRRVSAGDYSVRVFSRDYGRPEQSTCPPGQWCPPPECMPSSGIEADVVGEWTVTTGGGSDFPVREGEPARVLGVIVTWESQSEAAFGAIVRTADGVQSVRLTLDGVTDEMAPIDGVAVVVVPSSGLDVNDRVMFPAGARAEVVDASGAVSELPLSVGGMSDPACMPPPPAPPTLPEPGEQPADVAAAEATVRERFAYVFGPDSDAKLVEAVDDPTGLDVLRVELKDRHPEAVGNVEYEVGEVVFTAPDAAAYVFRPVVAGRPLPWQIGGARLVDGKWMITRGTVCAMYQLGGSRC